MPVTLLDTSALAPKERDVATREFLEASIELDTVGYACPPESIRTRVRTRDLRKFQLNVTDSPWLRFSLNRRGTTQAVCIAAQVSGQTAKTHGERRQTFNPREISLTDFSSPFQWRAAGDSTSMWFRFSYAELCLPDEAIRSAT